MKTPQTLSELSACLHVLAEDGAFMHFGTPHDVHVLIHELVKLLEAVQACEAELTPIEAKVLESFYLTLEPFLEDNETTEDSSLHSGVQPES